MTAFDPTTLNYDRPTSEWGDNERLYFPTLVEYVSREYGVTGDAQADLNKPLALAALGFAHFMTIALRLDKAKMVVNFPASRASSLLLADARRQGL